jgi:plasmid stabilization system protein ParE
MVSACGRRFGQQFPVANILIDEVREPSRPRGYERPRPEDRAFTSSHELARYFHRLADSPGLGRACDRIYPGIRRFEQGKHVIFYKPGRHGIVISRILHQRRLPTRLHFIDA